MKYLLILFTCFSFGQFNPVFFYYAGSSSKINTVTYSLRKYVASYSGNCVKVRRSSDNTELDIGFSSGIIDTASLTAFVGAGNGYVTTWYDQSGNARNMTQSTLAEQPTIVESGVVVLLNGKPAVHCSNQSMTASSVPLSLGVSNDVFSGFVVASKTTGGGLVTVNASSGYYQFNGNSGINNMNFRFNLTNLSTAETFVTTRGLLSIVRYSNTNMKYYRNNTLIADLALDGNWGTKNFTIGDNATVTGSTNCYYQEIVYYQNNLLTSLTSIHSEINSFYSIY